jgi:hypothetical protein
MSQPKILVTVDPLGKVTIEAQGFSGSSCEAATAGLEAALAGGSGMERTFKPEWVESGETTEEEHVRW